MWWGKLNSYIYAIFFHYEIRWSMYNYMYSVILCSAGECYNTHWWREKFTCHIYSHHRFTAKHNSQVSILALCLCAVHMSHLFWATYLLMSLHRASAHVWVSASGFLPMTALRALPPWFSPLSCLWKYLSNAQTILLQAGMQLHVHLHTRRSTWMTFQTQWTPLLLLTYKIKAEGNLNPSDNILQSA